jgi:O-methyltransferase involved in polyketide biosynthesis
MSYNKFSRTAIGTCYLRGYHATHDNQIIFNDSLAFNLLGEDIRESIEQQWVKLALAGR